MKKVITIFLFFSQLIIGETYAVNIDSTALAKQCFKNAKTEIELMLSGKDTLNYERAVFLTENAYWRNKFDYKAFDDIITLHALNIISFAETNREKKENEFKSDFISSKEQKQKYYEKALYNWAIFKYLTDTMMFAFDSSFYLHLPVKYSTNDPLGTLNWENSQILNLLNPDKNTGNCMAMTALFKIFSEKLNTNASIGTTPGHVYITHDDNEGTEYNVELASHSFPGAGSLMTLTYTSNKAVECGISMRKLNTKQSIALCLVYLAKGYEHKFNIKNDSFILECAETALQYDSLNLNAMLLKAEIFEARLIDKKKTISQLQKDSLFLQYQNLLSTLFEKGYFEMPSEMKDIIISKLRNEVIPYFAKNHTPQPFKDINIKEDRYATLSGGLFDEDPQPKAIERYGKTLFNTKSKRIIEFKEPDSTFSNYPVDPVVFAWAIDPLDSKYPNLSPYVAFADNPIYFIDQNGKAIFIFYLDENGESKYYLYGSKQEVPNNEFVQRTINSIDNVKNVDVSTGETTDYDPTFSYLITKLRDDVDHNAIIAETVEGNSYERYDENNTIIYFNPLQGVNYISYNKKGEKMTTAQGPAAIGLGHELRHLFHMFFYPDEYVTNYNQKTLTGNVSINESSFPNDEEFVTSIQDADYLQYYGFGSGRYSYYIESYNSVNETSTDESVSSGQITEGSAVDLSASESKWDW